MRKNFEDYAFSHSFASSRLGDRLEQHATFVNGTVPGRAWREAEPVGSKQGAPLRIFKLPCCTALQLVQHQTEYQSETCGLAAARAGAGCEDNLVYREKPSNRRAPAKWKPGATRSDRHRRPMGTEAWAQLDTVAAAVCDAEMVFT